MKLLFSIILSITLQSCHGKSAKDVNSKPVPPSAATYYISSKGLETNNGLSPNTPWPISRVTSFFLNGTRFLFKRGDTLYGRIATTGNFDNNVTSADSLIYDAYGAGARPIITTRAALEGWNVPANWKPTKYANVWRMSLPFVHNAYPRLFLNKGQGFFEATKAKDSASVSTNQLVSFANIGPPQTMHIYSVTNPATAFKSMEYPSDQNNTLQVANQTFVAVRNLDIRGSRGSAVDIEFSKDVVIENCNIGWDAGRIGIRLNHARNLKLINSTVDSGDKLLDNFLVVNGVADGIYIGSGCENIEVASNTLKNWGHSIVEITDENKNDAIVNVFIRNNYITAPDVDYCRGLGVNVNRGKNIVVERNLMENFPAQNQVTADNCFTFRYNIVNNVTQVNHYNTGTGIGLYIAGYSGYQPKGMQIVNNLFANCYTTGIQLAGYLDTSTTTIFTPSATLLPNTPYTATITTKEKNKEGKWVVKNHTWTFTTGNTTGDAPLLMEGGENAISTFPKNGARGVPLDAIVKFAFDVITDSTFSATKFILRQGATNVPGSLKHPPRYKAVTGNVIANNIFYNNGSNPRNPSYDADMFPKGAQLIIEHNPDVQDNIFKNNLFYSPLTNSVIKYGHDPIRKFSKTVSAFNALNGTVTVSGKADIMIDNIQIDPLLKPSSFEPGSNSPCVGRGLNIGKENIEGLLVGSKWPGGVLVGKQGGSWNIGPYVNVVK